MEYQGEKPLAYLTAEGRRLDSVPLVTTTEVQKAGLFTRIIRGLGRFFSGLWQSIIGLFK